MMNNAAHRLHKKKAQDSELTESSYKSRFPINSEAFAPNSCNSEKLQSTPSATMETSDKSTQRECLNSVWFPLEVLEMTTSGIPSGQNRVKGDCNCKKTGNHQDEKCQL